MWFLSLKHLHFFSFYTLKANPNIFKWYKALPVFISTSLTRYTMDDCHQTPVIPQHNRMTFNFTITILKLLPILFCLPESTNLPCLPVDLLLLLQCVPQRSFALGSFPDFFQIECITLSVWYIFLMKKSCSLFHSPVSVLLSLRISELFKCRDCSTTFYPWETIIVSSI